MPIRDSKEEYNAYMREYMLKRYKIRRAKAIEFLGSKCVNCNSIEELQFDHIHPSTKLFNIAKQSSVAEDKFWTEVKKCQLLCQECHTNKTLKDLNQVSAKTTHGTLSSYRYCKCELCKAANNIQSKIYKARKKLGSCA